MKKTRFIIGLIIALIGAGIMWHGNLLGEYNTNISIILGIVGISLIATSKYKFLGKK